ncbi:hypothetical protein [Brevibacillus panacihumi]|uniref:Uncharacterized protein n=1 Tax=Brevibacillus panacihumi TaxID=497735 RepID=A0A3M8CU47_9BACL|nr:hypothetical protein [Brevibacillus panacihumi]RNB78375.1 hypothetical protein EDM58_11245 [Brevibacillus panacihumi]
MSTRIEICWPDFDCTVRATLLSEMNPELCEEFKKTLPFSSIQSHAVVAGKQMYLPYRLVSEVAYQEEPMDQQPVGRVNIELDFQYLAMNYGPMTEPVPAVPLAQIVDEDLDKIQVIGEKVWHNLLFDDHYLSVHVRLAGGDER